MILFKRSVVVACMVLFAAGLTACGEDDTGQRDISSDASCDDGEQSGDQTDVDCGGSECEPCQEGMACEVAADCASNVCSDGVCAPATCDDGEQSGDQTDIDCGGEECPACPTGSDCEADGDCQSGQCEDGTCTISECADVDCDDGTTCYRGECHPECETSAQCDDDSRCFEGRCASYDCSDVVCDAGEQCHDGICYGACEDSEDCESDFASCEAGACVVPNCYDGDTTEDGQECPILDVETLDAEDIGADEATWVAEIHELPVDPPAEHGFCWSSETSEPEPGDDDSDCASLGTAVDTGMVTHDVDGLDAGTQYHVRAVFADDFDAGDDDELFLANTVDLITDAPSVEGVSATEGTSVDYVEITWEAVDASSVTGYRIERDGTPVNTVDSDATEFQDDNAEPFAGPTIPTDVTATQGELADSVLVEWQASTTDDAEVHDYTVVAVYPDTASAPSESDSGYRATEDVSTYEIEVDGQWIDVGLDTSYDDTSAPEPTIDVGTVSASDGSHTDYVEIDIENTVVEDGDSAEYRVRALTDSVTGDATDPVSGYRALDDPEFEIFRDGNSIATVDVPTYQDDDADEGQTPDAPSITATDGDHYEQVTVDWNEPDVSDGTAHQYTAVASANGISSDESAPATGARAGYPVSGYELAIDGNWLDVGSDTSYDHLDAPMPQIDAGDVTASEGTHSDYVEIQVDDAFVEDGDSVSYQVRAINDSGTGEDSGETSGYRGIGDYELDLYRDGDYIATIDGDSYQDTEAAEGSVPDAPQASATDGDHSDRVEITWTEPSVSSGSSHEYSAIAVTANASSGESSPDTGYRAGYPVSGYEVNIDGTWMDVGMATAHDDFDAPAPTVEPGSVTATDGWFGDRVELEHSGADTADGDERNYEVRALNATGTGAHSDEATGFRSPGDLELQWQRSDGDSDADYSDIAGGNSSPYDDDGAPADGSIRYYRASVSADGADVEYSDSDSGFRATQAVVDTLNPDDIRYNAATLNADLVDPGLPETTAYGVCIASTPDPEPSTADCNDLGTTTSSQQFEYDVDGLDLDTTYHARAYATTNAGTSFGDNVEFTTSDELRFLTESDWELGSPTPYELWSGLLEMEWSTDTPSNTTGLRFNGVDGNSGGTPYYYEVDVDLSQFNEMSVYTRKDNHNARNLQIDIGSDNVYDDGSVHGWTQRTYDVSNRDDVTTIRLGVESSSGDGNWTAGFAELEFTP